MSLHNKQRKLANKRRLEQLKKKRLRSGIPSPDEIIIRDPPGMEKMSEVLEDFVGPHWDQAPTEEALRNLLNVAAVAWNAALLPSEEREKLHQKSQQMLPADQRDDFRAIVDSLIQRKLAHFADNRRAILSIDLTMQPTGPYLEVMSTLPVE